MNSSQHFHINPDKHALILTTHGIHQWKVIPGLQDTGGQNIFVNQFADELARQGWKITIVNRGGYLHPITGEIQSGLHYLDEKRRLYYLEDGLPAFVRKEDMGDRVDACVRSLLSFVDSDSEIPPDIIISNYWDAAVIGEQYRQKSKPDIPHIWIPHSLGRIKKRNVSPDQWEILRIEERITYEKIILDQIDRVAATSPLISQSLRDDYSYSDALLWLPPCVSTDRYHPRTLPDNSPVWPLLASTTKYSSDEIRTKKIITEISRTDTTKRKDILIRAFATIREKHPDALLAIAVDIEKEPVGKELAELIKSLGLTDLVAILGSVWDILPEIYAASYIYCTPSIMEGFGMSAQEAAATAVPIVASSLVPFVTEYLQEEVIVPPINGIDDDISLGAGSIVAPPDNIEAFALALDHLLSDGEIRDTMGQQAYDATIPRFTWEQVVRDFLNEIETRLINA